MGLSVLCHINPSSIVSGHNALWFFIHKHECHCSDADLVELKLDFVFLWHLGEGQRDNAGSTNLGSETSEWGWTEWRSPVMWGISQRYWAHWELRVRRRSRNRHSNTCFNQGKGTVMLYFPKLHFLMAQVWWIYLIDKYNRPIIQSQTLDLEVSRSP